MKPYYFKNTSTGMIFKISDDDFTLLFLLLDPKGIFVSGHVHYIDDVPLSLMETIGGKHIVNATKWEYYRYTLKSLYNLALLLLSDAPIATRIKSRL